jgi:hypothetical protein
LYRHITKSEKQLQQLDSLRARKTVVSKPVLGVMSSGCDEQLVGGKVDEGG